MGLLPMGVGMSDRSQLPWAIVGTGPSRKDITDLKGLHQNRQVIGLNFAYEWMEVDYLAIVDNLAASYILPNVPPEIHLIVGENLINIKYNSPARHPRLQNKSIPERKDQERTLDIQESLKQVENKTVTDLFGPGVLSAAVHFIINKKATKFELYGIDGGDQSYDGQLDLLRFSMNLHNLTVVNCCPSSRFRGLPFEDRPWSRG